MEKLLANNNSLAGKKKNEEVYEIPQIAEEIRGCGDKYRERTFSKYP